MTVLQTILVGTDFSTDAHRAVKRAAIIGATTRISRAVVLHVLRSSWLDTLKHVVSQPSELDRSMKADALRCLDELVAEARGQSGLVLEPKVWAGNVVETILDASEGFNLLILGARGKHSAENFTVATTVERLLRQIQTPMLIIRKEASIAYRRTLVGVDFSEHSETALSFARAIAPQSEVCLAHVLEAPIESEMLSMGLSAQSIREFLSKARYEAEVEMKRFIEKSGADSRNLRVHIEHGNHVPTALRDKAIEIDADLVVVGKHGRTLFERLLLGSVTLRLLSDCPCDLLVTQQKAGL